ncbi:DrmB family protein [Desulfosporosinus sp. SYSU MS00001]|uniref:DrmB family protein n=1 Tax=Desulfosporosinus sp. SYSU MS00001 TaxID=3416284 RepID=UPI003CF83570
MKDLPLRRGQLVTTFGPGALVISPEGESAMIGALDRWFYDINERRIESLDEFEIHEPRLRSLLKVNKLLMPPDYRSGFKYNGESDINTQTNTEIYIPLLRFPTWHYCPACKTLHQIPMSSRSSWHDCKECKKLKKMIQVPFVIVCKHGHISDFPWREWVHGDENTNCGGQMKLVSTGGATLDSLKIKCSCNKERSLRGIMSRKSYSDNDDTAVSELSKRLNETSNVLYRCPGSMPWYGTEKEKEDCSAFPVAVLKNSINVYYPNTISAIYLPGENQAVEKLIDMFERNGITSSWLNVAPKLEDKIKLVEKLCPPEIQDYNQSDIELAILYIEGSLTEEHQFLDQTNPRNAEIELRKKEFEVLLQEIDSKNLKVRKEWAFDEADKNSYFNLINRVTKLKETIVLTGFNRLSPGEDSEQNQLIKGKTLLFKDVSSSDNNWLPAYKVYGEGLFFTLNREKLDIWEQRPEVLHYFSRLQQRVEKKAGNMYDLIVRPRNVLLHTLVHIIIDELALTCGYNSASLRERLYLGEDQSGALIYTSSGDIEGTFGGLVRVGRKEYFFPVVNKAVEKAKWCSSDPVCSEIGRTSGQGVNNLNGAACHSCAYLPETSCELGNLFLDRTLIIDPAIGFFNGE